MFSSSSELTVTALKSDDSDTIAWKLTTFEEVKQAIKFSSFRRAPKTTATSLTANLLIHNR